MARGVSSRVESPWTSVIRRPITRRIELLFTGPTARFNSSFTASCPTCGIALQESVTNHPHHPQPNCERTLVLGLLRRPLPSLPQSRHIFHPLHLILIHQLQLGHPPRNSREVQADGVVRCHGGPAKVLADVFRACADTRRVPGGLEYAGTQLEEGLYAGGADGGCCHFVLWVSRAEVRRRFKAGRRWVRKVMALGINMGNQSQIVAWTLGYSLSHPSHVQSGQFS